MYNWYISYFCIYHDPPCMDEKKCCHHILSVSLAINLNAVEQISCSILLISSGSYLFGIRTGLPVGMLFSNGSGHRYQVCNSQHMGQVITFKRKNSQNSTVSNGNNIKFWHVHYLDGLFKWRWSWITWGHLDNTQCRFL